MKINVFFVIKHSEVVIAGKDIVLGHVYNVLTIIEIPIDKLNLAQSAVNSLETQQRVAGNIQFGIVHVERNILCGRAANTGPNMDILDFREVGKYLNIDWYGNKHITNLFLTGGSSITLMASGTTTDLKI